MTWRPTHADPLFLLAMDHRDSFGRTLFGVRGEPTPAQLSAMRAAKALVYAGLQHAADGLDRGRAGVLVDEQLGSAVIAEARGTVVLAVPIEASGHDWFTPEHGDRWLEGVRAVRPDYAKVLVRDNPDFPADRRGAQLAALAAVSAGLRDAGIPLLYELLVPAAGDQAAAGTDAYDRDVRPGLVVRVLADNQAAGVEPDLWKVEGLDTAEAAVAVAEQARASGRTADLVVLGRDAPEGRLDTWLEVASGVPEFVGFAIGRSIFQDVVRRHVAGELTDGDAAAEIAERYLHFTRHWAG